MKNTYFGYFGVKLGKRIWHRHTRYAEHALKAKVMEVWKEDIHAFAISVV
jgi:hypothetical protein